MPVLEVGSVHLDLLLDTTLTIGGDSVFAPASREEWSPLIDADGDGIMTAPVQPLLIDGPDSYALVDTGFGDSSPGPDAATSDGATLRELAKRGVKPEDVSRVIITHAHGDHYLGNTVESRSGRAPTFPNAEYVIQKADADAFRSESPEEWVRHFQPLADSGTLRLVDGDTRLSDTVSCRLTQGHTIGHQSVVITSGGQSVCYLGDLAIKMLNLQRPEWGPDWAWSREKDIENRKAICRWAADENAVLILLHDDLHPFVRVRHAGGDLVVEDA